MVGSVCMVQGLFIWVLVGMAKDITLWSKKIRDCRVWSFSQFDEALLVRIQGHWLVMLYGRVE